MKQTLNIALCVFAISNIHASEMQSETKVGKPDCARIGNCDETVPVSKLDQLGSVAPQIDSIAVQQFKSQCLATKSVGLGVPVAHSIRLGSTTAVVLGNQTGLEESSSKASTSGQSFPEVTVSTNRSRGSLAAPCTAGKGTMDDCPHTVTKESVTSKLRL